MTYTLWSRGRLLGTTDLGWARAVPRQRTGDIAPTPLGEALLPVACGVRPALRLHGHDLDHPAVRAAVEQRDALALELHGPDGEIVPTADLWIQDSEYLRSLSHEPPLLDGPEPEWLEDLELDPYDQDREAALAELPDLPDPPELSDLDGDAELDDEPSVETREWPRYQLMVVLRDDSAIP